MIQLTKPKKWLFYNIDNDFCFIQTTPLVRAQVWKETNDQIIFFDGNIIWSIGFLTIL